jgi:hypothetical protein
MEYKCNFTTHSCVINFIGCISSVILDIVLLCISHHTCMYIYIYIYIFIFVLLMITFKGKGKAVQLHAMEALMGRGGIAPTHSRPRH